MEENTTLKNLFGALQKQMVADAAWSKVLRHPVDKGDNTEKSWIDWFNKYLPKRYKAAKATVIDSKGKASDQIDIVLYDEQYSYLIVSQHDTIYIPAESVYAVFEVKQTLNKGNMEKAGEKAESVRQLYRTSVKITSAGGDLAPKKPQDIIAGILTTSFDWKDKPFGDSFYKCMAAYTDMQHLDCGCVLNDGAFFYDYKSGILKTSGAEESLVYFFLQLLIQLQNVGTVRAIDLNAYMQALTISEDVIRKSSGANK